VHNGPSVSVTTKQHGALYVPLPHLFNETNIFLRLELLVRRYACTPPLQKKLGKTSAISGLFDAESKNDRAAERRIKRK
jgi:hypothetical protein